MKSFYVLLFALWFSVPAWGAPGVSSTLSQAVKANLTGLDFDKNGIELLRKQAHEFILFKKGGMPANERLLWVAHCISQSQENSGANYFCDFMAEKTANRLARALASQSDLNADAQPRDDEQEVTPPATAAELIAKGNLSGIRNLTDGQIYKALKTFKSWEPLQVVSEAALDSNRCKNASILTMLGQKAEEYFPDPKFRRLAMDMYARAAECSDVAKSSKAAYRLSLFRIWGDDVSTSAEGCKSVEPLLERLSADPKGDYASRALYWRTYCAKEQGEKLLFSALRLRMIKDFPLSYHSIALVQGMPAQALRLLGNEEPTVLFRSQMVPEANRVIRAIEVLQTLGANEIAHGLLSQLDEKVLSAEPQFRLYISLLMARSGDHIGQFRLLAGVFRDDPSLISQATLKLFYPLKQFSILEQHGSRIDPYLTAALIRQESGFNERAHSRAGAIGLMQLMPQTARTMERVSGRQLYTVSTNVRIGVRFFQNLVNRFGMDAEMALAAYNAGPDRVDEWKKRYPTTNRMLFLDMIPFKETRDYVSLIARNYYWYRNLYSRPQSSESQVVSVRRKARRTLASDKTLIFTVPQQ